jgi:hypothetical protein
MSLTDHYVQLDRNSLEQFHILNYYFNSKIVEGECL